MVWEWDEAVLVLVPGVLHMCPHVIPLGLRPTGPARRQERPAATTRTRQTALSGTSMPGCGRTRGGRGIQSGRQRG